MTNIDRTTLISLLEKLKKENLTIPNMPLDIWFALNKVVPLTAVEVIITNTGKDLLLTKRKDMFWDGWHIPGGFIGLNESIEDTCKRVAREELGISIEFKEVLDAYVWPDHPYASSISIICRCKTSDKPKVGKFFRKIPKKIVSHHDEFIEIFRKKAEVVV